MRKDKEELRLDIRAGQYRFEFDMRGCCRQTEKKRLGRDNRPANTDIMYGQIDIRLGLNLEQTTECSQDTLL